VLDDLNVARDKTMPVAQRLEELAKNEVNPHQSTVLVYGLVEGDDLPSIAPQNVLWARHQHVFAGLSGQENKERYYQYLYYLNVDETSLENRLRNGDFVSMISLFGWSRHTNRLSSVAEPLTYGEIAEEARRYGAYRKHFSLKEATNPTLSYIIVAPDWEVDFTNVDIWYERDSGEKIGEFTLYRVKVKRQK
jgi:hypothetical protein